MPATARPIRNAYTAHTMRLSAVALLLLLLAGPLPAQWQVQNSHLCYGGVVPVPLVPPGVVPVPGVLPPAGVLPLPIGAPPTPELIPEAVPSEVALVEAGPPPNKLTFAFNCSIRGS